MARDAPIEQRLHEGQEVVVQVAKEPLGTKGARITTHVSLPGRYLVFMPTVEHVGVSRKITDDEERRRLKTILKELRQEHGGGGFIARTAGAKADREEFVRDARYLTRIWDEVRAQASRQPAPALLHRELGLVQRLLRDLLSADVASIRLDSPREFQSTLDLVSQLSPELAARVRQHGGPTPIMEEHGVSTELERALRSKVWLESGGYIVINQTEALVAIDVNTGRYTGKKALEETILKTNLEAAKEIVRQIRLRDLGGIIVVDFIDMEERKSRQKLMGALDQELRRDRSPSKVLSVNEFGLVILTRKRVRQSLERLLCQACPYCTGSGMIKSVATVCSEIYDEVRKLAADMRGHGLLLRVNPEVARALAGDEAGVLKDLTAARGPRHPGPWRPAAPPGAVRRGAALTRGPGRRRSLRARDRDAPARAPGHGPHPLARATSRSRASWHGAGVPLATVLIGMDRAFETGANVTSLAYCRRWVEDLAAAGPPSVRPAPPAESIPLREVEGVLSTLLEQLGEDPPRQGPVLRPAGAQDPRGAGPDRGGLAAELELRAHQAARDRRRGLGGGAGVALGERPRGVRAGSHARDRAPPRPGGRRRPARRHEPLHAAARARTPRTCRGSASSERQRSATDVHVARARSRARANARGT